MAGRPKVKCYEYNPDGMYLQEYESIAEVRDKYFPEDKGIRPLFKTGTKDYFKLDNGNFIANYKIGKENLRRLERVRNCVYCNNNGNIKDKQIEVFNLKGEKIAEFKNVYIASRICNIPHSTLSQRLNPKNNKRNKVNKDNLEFRFK